MHDLAAVLHAKNTGGDWTPGWSETADFVTDGKGVRLERNAYARVLTAWETHWTRLGVARQLDETVLR